MRRWAISRCSRRGRWTRKLCYARHGTLTIPGQDAAGGAEAALGLGMLFGISGSFTDSTMWLDRALGSATGGEPWYDAARSMRAIPFTLSGEGDKALALFRDLPERAAMVPIAKTDSVTYRGMVKLWTGDLPGAIEDLGLAVSRIRAGLQVRFPGQPLAFLAEAEFRRGRWDDCQDHAELAVSLARDADRYYDLPIVHSAAARVPACRGDWAVADTPRRSRRGRRSHLRRVRRDLRRLRSQHPGIRQGRSR